MDQGLLEFGEGQNFKFEEGLEESGFDGSAMCSDGRARQCCHPESNLTQDRLVKLSARSQEREIASVAA